MARLRKNRDWEDDYEHFAQTSDLSASGGVIGPTYRVYPAQQRRALLPDRNQHKGPLLADGCVRLYRLGSGVWSDRGDARPGRVRSTSRGAGVSLGGSKQARGDLGIRGRRETDDAGD